jgi:hypothetical protein
MPHQFGEAVEAFVDIVLKNWDGLYAIEEYTAMCEKLYELYHAETEKVEPASTESVFGACLNNLMLTHKKVGGTIKLAHGFYEFWHNNAYKKGALDPNELPYRIYLNASTSNVMVLGFILVQRVCLTGDALYFKIASTAAAVDSRKDAIVIYLFGREKAERLARDLGEITGNELTPSVPGLTKEIAHGISVAVDPSTGKDKVSFGQSRVRPFATAIRCYRDTFGRNNLLGNLSGENHYEIFTRLLAGAFRAHRISPIDPSTTGNTVPRGQDEISNGADVAAGSVTVPKMDVNAARIYARMAARGAFG